MSSYPKPRVLIIGIDGATPDLIYPWVEEGRLPNIAKLMSSGVHGPLASTIPPITPAAWTSFMTGVNPAKHGIFDFIENVKGTYEFRFINARARKAQSIWRLLSESGLKVGVLNVPMTYPPEEVGGFMISGLDAPEESRATYPSALYDELKRETGGFQLDIRHLGGMKSDSDRFAFLSEVEQVEEQRVRVLLYLQQKYATDVLMIVFNATDQLQHHFWHYMDPTHPKYDPAGAEKFGDAIFRIYSKIDALIGVLLENIPPTDATIIMSDHGAGPTSRHYLNTNAFLAEMGLLKFKKNSLASGIKKFTRFLKTALSDRQKKLLATMLPALRQRIENYTILGSLDLERTKAFSIDMTGIAPYIWVNMGGRFPAGAVMFEKQRAEVMDEIIKGFEALGKQLNPDGSSIEVFKKEQVFEGPYVSLAPDLIPATWSRDGFNLRNDLPDGSINHKSYGLETGQIRSGVEWSGTHRSEGFFLLKSDKVINAGNLGSANIVDVFPTILTLLGIPVPNGLDGRAIENVIKK